MKTLLLTLAVIVLAAFAVSEYVDAEKDLLRNKLDYAGYICNKANAEIDGRSEDECGRMLDETNMQYTCNFDRSRCWLEAK